MRSVENLFGLTGKVALVTGATGHLGSAIVEALAEAGANVVASSRQLADAQRVADRLPRVKEQKHFAVQIDQMDAESRRAGFERAIELAGRADILVNNGHAAIEADWRNVSAEQFDQHLRNATAYFELARMFRDHVVSRQAQGSVILLGSMYGIVGSYPDAYEGICDASPVAYHTLKGGVIHMTRHLAVYWAKDRVRVNCLSPGPFPTDQAPREFVQRLAAKSPMGRIGQPDEVKGAVVFLASEASSYVTGHNLLVDGGWTAW